MIHLTSFSIYIQLHHSSNHHHHHYYYYCRHVISTDHVVTMSTEYTVSYTYTHTLIVGVHTYPDSHALEGPTHSY